VVDFAHKIFPNQLKAKKGYPGDFPKPFGLPNNTKSQQILGLTYCPKEATYHDTISQFLQDESLFK
jgi:hypothetical protein